MNQQTSFLVELQTVDSELDRINHKTKELPEKRAALDEGLRLAGESFEGEKKKLDDAAKLHKEREENLKKGVETLKKTKDRLQEVKNNKEYQAMLKEIESLEKKNGEVEDEIIKALDEVDRTKKEFKEKEKDLAATRQTYEKDVKEIDQELARIEAQQSVLEKKREDLQAKVKKDMLKRYETIKSKRNGLAVVTVWKGVCDGCHMGLPPQLYIELQRSDEMMQCPYCSRIIYWDRNHDQSNG